MQVIQSIQNRIYEIRGARMMLDFDLAALYEVPAKALNQAVKRNIKRFPKDFMFRLTLAEWQNIRSQTVTAYETPHTLRSQNVTESQSKRNTSVTQWSMGNGQWAPTECRGAMGNQCRLLKVFAP